jgi:hypothetical protein
VGGTKGRSVTDDGAAGRAPTTSRRRQVAGILLLVAVAAAVATTVLRNRTAFVDSIDRVGPLGLLSSLALALVGIGATALQWRAVLGGLGVRFEVRDGARVFFVSQLGKYLPGSVWPIVVQVEAGRRRGAARPTVLAANLVTVVLSLATGAVLAGALLPFSSPDALRRYWWALAALPLILVLAHPRTVPWLLDRVLRVLRRPPLGVAMSGAATARAIGWSLVSWVALGLHVAVLVAALGQPGWGVVALSVGGTSLAVTAGVLLVPVPAGAGLREVVLGAVLSTALAPGQVIAVVVASRVLLVTADLLLAAASALAARRPGDA